LCNYHPLIMAQVLKVKVPGIFLLTFFQKGIPPRNNFTLVREPKNAGGNN
jgi:hypothetical protein